MAGKTGFIKSTVIGGILFLVPVAVITLVVGKLVGVIGHVTERITPILRVETVLGAFILNLIALVVVIALCFLAGLVAQRARAKRMRARLEEGLLTAVPGYSFVKGFADSMRQSDELAENFFPVVVRFDDYGQLAFEIERLKDGHVVVFLPGAPNPWSGSVTYFTPDRVTRVSMSVREAVKNIRMLGRGSAVFEARMEEHRAESNQTT
jgi:uncharacterized membrane protein